LDIFFFLVAAVMVIAFAACSLLVRCLFAACSLLVRFLLPCFGIALLGRFWDALKTFWDALKTVENR
jgi:hypothetical protein